MTNSIIRMNENDKWINPRIHYLKSFIRPSNTTCPECGGELEILEDEITCTECNLIVGASSRYVAGEKIDLPYGLRL